MQNKFRVLCRSRDFKWSEKIFAAEKHKIYFDNDTPDFDAQNAMCQMKYRRADKKKGGKKSKDRAMRKFYGGDETEKS